VDNGDVEVRIRVRMRVLIGLTAWASGQHRIQCLRPLTMGSPARVRDTDDVVLVTVRH
jgi:hypothetical protein